MICIGSRTQRYDSSTRTPGTAPFARCLDCGARVQLYVPPVRDVGGVRRYERWLLTAHEGKP